MSNNTTNNRPTTSDIKGSNTYRRYQDITEPVSERALYKCIRQSEIDAQKKEHRAVSKLAGQEQKVLLYMDNQDDAKIEGGTDIHVHLKRSPPHVGGGDDVALTGGAHVGGSRNSPQRIAAPSSYASGGRTVLVAKINSTTTTTTTPPPQPAASGAPSTPSKNTPSVTSTTTISGSITPVLVPKRPDSSSATAALHARAAGRPATGGRVVGGDAAGSPAAIRSSSASPRAGSAAKNPLVTVNIPKGLQTLHAMSTRRKEALTSATNTNTTGAPSMGETMPTSANAIPSTPNRPATSSSQRPAAAGCLRSASNSNAPQSARIIPPSTATMPTPVNETYLRTGTANSAAMSTVGGRVGSATSLAFTDRPITPAEAWRTLTHPAEASTTVDRKVDRVNGTTTTTTTASQHLLSAGISTSERISNNEAGYVLKTPALEQWSDVIPMRHTYLSGPLPVTAVSSSVANKSGVKGVDGSLSHFFDANDFDQTAAYGETMGPAQPPIPLSGFGEGVEGARRFQQAQEWSRLGSKIGGNTSDVSGTAGGIPIRSLGGLEGKDPIPKEQRRIGRSLYMYSVKALRDLPPARGNANGGATIADEANTLAAHFDFLKEQYEAHKAKLEEGKTLSIERGGMLLRSAEGDEMIGVFEPCYILDFNHESRTYTIQWCHALKEIKVVYPLNLQYPNETTEEFQQRIAVAEALRDEAEAVQRLREYAKRVVAPQVPPMPEEQLERILLAVSAFYPKQHAPLMQQCIAEVTTDLYEQGVKMAILRQHLKSYTNRLKLKDLRLPNKTAWMLESDKKDLVQTGGPHPDIRHLRACIEVVPGVDDRRPELAKVRKFLADELFVAHKSLYKVVRFAVNCWSTYDKLQLCITDIDVLKPPLQVSDFLKIQTDICDTTADVLSEQWLGTIGATVQNELSVIFNLMITDPQEFLTSRMNRFLKRINFTLAGQLQGMVYDAIAEMTRFFQSMRPDALTIRALEEERAGHGSRTGPAFLRRIGCFGKSKVVPPSLRASEAPGVGDEAFMEDMPPSSSQLTLLQGIVPLLVIKLDVVEYVGDGSVRHTMDSPRRGEEEEKGIAAAATPTSSATTPTTDAGKKKASFEEGGAEAAEAENDTANAPPVLSSKRPPRKSLGGTTLLRERIEFVPPLWRIEEAVQSMFFNALENTDQMAALGPSLFPILNMETRKLTEHARSIRGDDQRVNLCQEEMKAMLVENLGGPLALIKLYQDFQYLLDIDVDEYIQQFIHNRPEDLNVSPSTNKATIAAADVYYQQKAADNLKKKEELLKAANEKSSDKPKAKKAKVEEKVWEEELPTKKVVAVSSSASPPLLEDYDHICGRITDHIDLIQRRSLSEVNFPLVRVECKRLKDLLCARAKLIISGILSLLIEATNERIDAVDAEFQHVYDRVQVEPKDPIELQQLKEFVDAVPSKMQALGVEFDGITESVHLLGKYGFMPDQNAFEKYWESYSWPRKIAVLMDDVPSQLQLYRAQFMAELRERIEKLKDEIAGAQRQIQILSYKDNINLASQVVTEADGIEKLLAKLRDGTNTANEHEKVFQLQPTKWTALREAEKQFQPFATLWRIANDTVDMESWVETPIGDTSKFNAQDIQMKHSNWTKEIGKLVRLQQAAYASGKADMDGDATGDLPSAVIKSVKDRLDHFKPLIPLALALAKPCVINQPRQHVKVAAFIGQTAKTLNLAGRSLSQLVEMGLLKHIADVVEMSKNAEQEAKLEAQLSSMKEAWARVNFSFMPFYDTLLLQSTDGVRDLLDEHIMKTQTMVASPYAAAIMSELRPWEEKLSRMSATLDAWLLCQAGLHYLDPIFTHSKDIAKAMPEEAKLFEFVRGSWVMLMESVSKVSHVATRCSEERLLPLFNEHNPKLDKILKELVKYLDTKRAAFPRFYFLSNEDLIEILSQSADPTLVQPHIRKCFEGIYRLVFSGEAELEKIALANQQREYEKRASVVAIQKQRESAAGSGANAVAAAAASGAAESKFNPANADKEPPHPSLTIVQGMRSEMDERVMFLAEVDPVLTFECVVENWLKAVEQRMCEAVNTQTIAAFNDYLDTCTGAGASGARSAAAHVAQTDSSSHNQALPQRRSGGRASFVKGPNIPTAGRTGWALRWPGQVVTTVSQMVWTMEVEDAITQGKLQQCEVRVKRQLNELALLVREDLSAVDLQTLQVLIILDIHARDVTSMLYDKSISELDDFSWISQLRYYIERPPERRQEKLQLTPIAVKQTIASLPYGNEYLGNTSRLIITPLTDRCYRCLTAAYHLNYGGAPEGPAGTGKTETTKDLAKCIARMCVVFNCSDNVKPVEFEKMLRGLAASGGWGCFDEFNRIETQVLSVIAQQVLSIQLAVAEKKNSFLFEGSLSDLKTGCSIFVTMNPGYAGRSELPDNLKALFRPVAMMVPDYALIAENSLYSCGFLDATILSKKIVATYKLASEQLSSQSHYDFGMRAVKAVLNSAQALRKQNPEESELHIVMRAVRDVNIPKFLATDTFLFDGIIRDLFGDIQLAQADYSDLLDGINVSAKKRNLQTTAFFVRKMFEVYEMVKVRHGLMMVGASLCGKTATLTALSEGLSWARKHRKTFNTCHTHRLNPKSVTMNQLYGYNDASGTEWHDGILSSIFREASLETDNKVFNWLMLDGPVDAIWIENMNTVLDDNKKLSLPNGDFIRMSAGMSMMFVVQDLRAASPATVSRCGIIYMEPSELGWRPLVDSWKHKMAMTSEALFGADTPVAAAFEALFSTLLPAALEFLKTEPCALPFTSQMQTQQLLTLLEVMSKVMLLSPYEESVARVSAAANANMSASPTGGNAGGNGGNGGGGGGSAFMNHMASAINNTNAAKEAAADTADGDLLESVNPTDLLHYAETLFVYCLMWSMGSLLSTPESRVKFQAWLFAVFNTDSSFARRFGKGTEVLYRPAYALAEQFGGVNSPAGHGIAVSLLSVKLTIPSNWDGMVHWVDWLSSVADSSNPTGHLTEQELDTPYHEIMVPTAESVTYDYLCKTLLDHRQPVLIVGGTGTKTQTIKSTLKKFNRTTFNTMVIQFSAQTTAASLQSGIERTLERRGGRKFGPPQEKSMVVFVDDLAMPEPDKYGTQAPIELLRQFLQVQGWFSTSKVDFGFKNILDVLLIAATQPPTAARAPVTNRLVRHFFVSYLPPQSTETLKRIFGYLLDHTLMQPGVAPTLRNIKDATVAYAVDVFQTVAERLLPTPEKSHYVFNLRDLCRVFQGVASLHGPSTKEENQLVGLVTHELIREFGDRLTCDSDSAKLEGILREKLQLHLKKSLEGVLQGDSIKDALYSNVFSLDPTDRNYVRVSHNIDEGQKALENALQAFNAINSSSRRLDLIVFDFVMRHVARVCRSIQQPSGSVMLVGLGGSGRRSVCRLAAVTLGYTVCTPTPSRNYNRDAWREDVSIALRAAGERGQPTMLLLVDSDITQEVFCEDISNLLNTGEVPGLYSADAFEPIAHNLRPVLRDANIDFTIEAAMEMFVSRVRSNLHFALCFSPVGSSLRDRLRKFPAIANCCSIDWILPWPEKDLYKVGHHRLTQVATGQSIIENADDGDAAGDAPLPSLIKPSQVASITSVLVRMFDDARTETAKGIATRTQPVNMHVTPTVFLDLVETVLHYSNKIQRETVKLRDRYERGLRVMFETEDSVNDMQEVLKKNQPILEEKAQEVKALITEIDGATAEADKERKEVAIEEEQADAIMREARAVKEECEANLAVAMPAMEAATSAVSRIDKNHLVELKSFTNPPERMKKVIEALCIVLSVKPNEKRDMMGRKEVDYWAPTKTKVMADVEQFKNMLINFDKENMDAEIFEKKIIPYIKDKNFTPENVKDISIALVGVCVWVRAMETYYRVVKIVKPKQIRLAAAEAEYNTAMAILNEKKERLAGIDARLKQLQTRLEDCTSQRTSLEAQKYDTETKLHRAVRVIGGLQEEKVRYAQQVEQLTKRMETIVGDAVLSAGMVSCLGPFTHELRMSLLEKWIKATESAGVSVSPNFDFALTHSTELQHLQWKSKGLPVDDFSRDSATIIYATTKFPYIVDPQGQASIWLKAAEKSANEKNDGADGKSPDGSPSAPTAKKGGAVTNANVDLSADESTRQLIVVRQSDAKFQQQLTNCVRNGHSLIVEDCREQIDPMLANVLAKNVAIFNGKKVISLGDVTIPFNDDFRLFMLTRSDKPHFAPELSTKVTIVGFFITPNGLTDQVVQRIIQHEEKEQLEKRTRVVEQQSFAKAQLVEIEDTILEMVSGEGDILVNDDVADTLDQSKRTSVSIAQRLADGEAFYKTFEKIRSRFVECGSRVSSLFFTLSSLSSISPMYQFSLEFFMGCLTNALNYVPPVVEDDNASPMRDPATGNLIANSNFNSPFTNNAQESHAAASPVHDDADKPKIPPRHVTARDKIDAGIVDDINTARDLRAVDIREHFYMELHRNVSQALFSQDQLGYSFLFAARANDEDADEMSFLATGGLDIPSSTQFPACPEGFTSECWAAVCRASQQLPNSLLARLPWMIAEEDAQGMYFKKFANKTLFAEKAAEADALMTTNTIVNLQPTVRIGGPWDERFSPLQKLVAIRCIRPDLVTEAIRAYVSLTQSARYLTPPILDVGEILHAQKPNPQIPLFFVLSSGADPMATVRSLAEAQGMTESFVTISLGSGMALRAETAIKRGLEMGHWVMLQNCHLYKDFMPSLDRLIEDYSAASERKRVNNYFRLWLTAMPSSDIPSTLLQKAVKMVMEPPRGMKSNLANSYAKPPLNEEEFFESSNDPPVWKKLAFAVCFFHAVLQERCSYGPIAWNIPYSFNDADLRISLLQVKLFVDRGTVLREQYTQARGRMREGTSISPNDTMARKASLLQSQVKGGGIRRTVSQAQAHLNNVDELSQFVSFESMRYLIGECNYGGRVTDSHDRRLLNELVDHFINPEMLTMMAQLDPSSNAYPMPPAVGGDAAFYLNFIDSLPDIPSPGALGLHANCTMTRSELESNALLHAIASTLPKQVAGASEDNAGGEGGVQSAEEKRLIEICEITLARVRKPYDVEMIQTVCPITTGQFENVVLIQELRRFNDMISRIRKTLHALTLALRGEVVLTNELDSIAKDILVGQPPQAWASVSYPTTKPYGSFIADLVKRLDVFDQWVETRGPSPVCWLGGLFFPQSFITGVLQRHCRNNPGLTIDRLTWDNRVCDVDVQDAQTKERAEEGWYFGGLLLEGCRWDPVARELREAKPGILTEALPIIHLFPVKLPEVLVDVDDQFIGAEPTESGTDSDADGGGRARVAFAPAPPAANATNAGSLSRRSSMARRASLSAHHFATLKQEGDALDATGTFKAGLLKEEQAAQRDSLNASYNGNGAAPVLQRHTYDCPIYRTGARRGVLATTGHSTNFIMRVELPIARNSTASHWTKRGAALLTSSNL